MKQLIAYAQINDIIVGLIEYHRFTGSHRAKEVRYYISIFSTLDQAQKCKDFGKSKSFTYTTASKRFAKLCKAAQSMIFKTTNNIENEKNIARSSD